jgi:Glycosyltransferase family 87
LIDLADADARDEAASAPPLVSTRGLVLAARALRLPVAARGLRNVVYVTLVLAALAWMYFDVRWGYVNDALALDFKGTLWNPGIAILHGESPYPAPRESEVDVGYPAYYPPLLMLLVAPLTYLPWALGAVLWTALLLAALIGSLCVLGVRDLRCYALALISAPVVSGLMWGNATLLLVCLVALTWRWRAHPYRVAALIGLAIAVKLFLWPLAFWLLGTGRYRAAATAGAIATVGVFVPWAIIGFDGLLAYPDLLRVAQEIYALHGYSVATIFGALGVESELATWCGLATGTAVGLLAFVAGRRGHDEASISLAILSALIASPIVWEHYFALLLIPLAIARPRFSALWMTLPLFHVALSLPAPKLGKLAAEPDGIACCPPEDVPLSAWLVSHAPPALWPALGHAALAALIGLGAWTITRRRLTSEASA